MGLHTGAGEHAERCARGSRSSWSARVKASRWRRGRASAARADARGGGAPVAPAPRSSPSRGCGRTARSCSSAPTSGSRTCSRGARSGRRRGCSALAAWTRTRATSPASSPRSRPDAAPGSGCLPRTPTRRRCGRRGALARMRWRSCRCTSAWQFATGRAATSSRSQGRCARARSRRRSAGTSVFVGAAGEPLAARREAPAAVVALRGALVPPEQPAPRWPPAARAPRSRRGCAGCSTPRAHSGSGAAARNLPGPAVTPPLLRSVARRPADRPGSGRRSPLAPHPEPRSAPTAPLRGSGHASSQPSRDG